MWFKKKKKPVEALAQQELTAPILEPLPVLPEEPAELPEVALEDILNEFGGDPATEEAPEAETAEAEPAAGEADEEPADAELVTEASAEAEPVANETVAMEPLSEEPQEAEPMTDETAVPEAVNDETIVMEPVGDETAVMESVGDESVVMEPVGDETVVMEPVGDETVVMEPVGDETVVMEPVTGDTVVMEPIGGETDDLGDTVRFAPVTGDTIVMEPMGNAAPETDPLGDTVRFAPVTDDTQRAEPFGDGWEPEYEQPIGEYVPPQPISFRPKSRLRELKRKLVAGPERRYYELSERGFGRLQLAIFVSLVVAVLTAGATVFFAFDWIAPERLKLVKFLQLFGMLICTLMGTFELMSGVEDLFKGRFSLNSLLVFSFLACIADGVFCLRDPQRIPCCAAFSVQMTMSLWSAYHRRRTEIGQMDTMRKATRLDSVIECPEYYEGVTGFRRGEGQVEHFMDHYQERSFVDKGTSLYALIALCISVSGAVVVGVLQRSVPLGLQVLATALMASVPGTFFVSTSRPMAILEKRLHKLGTVLCGWKAIDRLNQKAVFPLSHEDLFPATYCSLNGVKFYGDRDPDQVVAYATAVISADGGGLTPLFEQLLASRQGLHHRVENLRLYGGGGIGGEVCGEPVLVGVLEFLKAMGVEVPDGTMVDRAVYVAVDGTLSGVFAVTYEKSRASATGLETLCSYKNLSPVMVTNDFMLTDGFIQDCFDVNTRRMVFPEFNERNRLASVPLSQDAPGLALVTEDGLASFAFAVTGARAVRTASRLGFWVHLLGGVLGMASVITLAVLGATHLLTPVNMLLFQLIWIVPGLLITEWTRSV